jgi:prepilin peptidase CpaA
MSLAIAATLMPFATAAAAALLLLAAIEDAASRTISNRLSILIAVAALPLLLAVAPVDALSHLVVATLSFAAACSAFARGWLGGGDVKLFSAVALWAGPSLFAMFVTVLSLAAVLIAVTMLLLNARRLSADMALPDASPMRRELPLGIAIASGGLVVLLYRAALLPLGGG